MYNPIVASAAAIKEVKKETVTITEIHIEISAFLSTLHTIFLSNVLLLCIYSSFDNYISKALGCCYVLRTSRNIISSSWTNNFLN